MQDTSWQVWLYSSWLTKTISSLIVLLALSSPSTPATKGSSRFMQMQQKIILQKSEPTEMQGYPGLGDSLECVGSQVRGSWRQEARALCSAGTDMKGACLVVL